MTFMTHKPRLSLVNTYKKVLYESIISEGGNALEQVNSVVPVEFLHATRRAALESINLGSVDYDIVGNTSKKLLGDVDISVSLDDIAKEYQILSIEKPEDFWKDLNYKLSSFGVDYTINKAFSQFHILAPLVDTSGKHLDAVNSDGDEIKGTPGFVQIDVFVGNKEWMKNILSGSPQDSKHKAVYRNLLLVAVVSNIPSEETDAKYSLNFRDGLKIIKYKRLPSGKTKNLESKVVMTSADEIGEWLFGVPWSEINSFEKLWDELNSSNFEHPESLPKIFQDYKQILLKNKKELPQELEIALGHE